MHSNSAWCKFTGFNALQDGELYLMLHKTKGGKVSFKMCNTGETITLVDGRFYFDLDEGGFIAYKSLRGFAVDMPLEFLDQMENNND